MSGSESEACDTTFGTLSDGLTVIRLDKISYMGYLLGMQAHPDNEFGKVIRQAFQRSGMSIKALADRSGVSYSVVHATVKGERDPMLSTAARLCRVLGLKLRKG